MGFGEECGECDNSKGTGHRQVVELYGELALDKQHAMSV